MAYQQGEQIALLIVALIGQLELTEVFRLLQGFICSGSLRFRLPTVFVVPERMLPIDVEIDVSSESSPGLIVSDDTLCRQMTRCVIPEWVRVLSRP